MQEDDNKTLQCQLDIEFYADKRFCSKVEYNPELMFIAYAFLLDALVCNLPDEKSHQLWRRVLDLASYCWVNDIRIPEHNATLDAEKFPEPQDLIYSPVSTEEEPLFTTMIPVLSENQNFFSSLSFRPEECDGAVEMMAEAADAVFADQFAGSSPRAKLLLTGLAIAQCNFYLAKGSSVPDDFGTAPNIAIPYIHRLAIESAVEEE